MKARRYIPQYTSADYEAWEGDWELWHGVPVSMSPSPGVAHQRVAAALFSQLKNTLDNDNACPCQVLYEIDWRIGADTVVRPDLLIVCGEITTNWIEQTPSLVAEVLSPATAHKDRTAKRSLYAEQGVGWYLLADPETASLDVLRLAGDDYSAHPSDAQIEVAPGCEVHIDASKLFG